MLEEGSKKTKKVRIVSEKNEIYEIEPIKPQKTLEQLDDYHKYFVLRPDVYSILHYVNRSLTLKNDDEGFYLILDQVHDVVKKSDFYQTCKLKKDEDRIAYLYGVVRAMINPVLKKRVEDIISSTLQQIKQGDELFLNWANAKVQKIILNFIEVNKTAEELATNILAELKIDRTNLNETKITSDYDVFVVNAISHIEPIIKGYRSHLIEELRKKRILLEGSDENSTIDAESDRARKDPALVGKYNVILELDRDLTAKNLNAFIGRFSHPTTKKILIDHRDSFGCRCFYAIAKLFRNIFNFTKKHQTSSPSHHPSPIWHSQGESFADDMQQVINTSMFARVR